MIRPVLLLPLAAVAASPVSAAERRFDLVGFQKVALGGSDSAIVKQGPYLVRAVGEADDLDRLEVKLEGDTLTIGRKQGNWGWGSKRVRFEISLPSLKGVSVGGSGSLEADVGSGDSFRAAVGGSGNLSVARVDARAVSVAVAGSGSAALPAVAAPEVSVTLSGSGGARLGGQCQQLDVKVSGSGGADLAALKCATANVRVAGSGGLSVNASQTASIRKAGSGNVRVSGGARCTTSVAGSGKVDCS